MLHVTILLAIHTLQCREVSLRWLQQGPRKVSSDAADHIHSSTCTLGHLPAFSWDAAAPDTHSTAQLTSHAT